MKKILTYGFTFVELVVIMGIIAISASFITLDFLKSRNTTSLNSTIQILISDINSQQLKIMSGNINNITNTPFGIYFEPNKYTTFHSSTFTNNDPSNFVTTLDSDKTFYQINFPGSQIIFASTSGEIQNYNNAQNTIIVKSIPNNQQKTITINQYGVIINVQ
ncbi:MAG: type II secretion system protein [bacterium]|nr:type II secretion system protein [bacterium]